MIWRTILVSIGVVTTIAEAAHGEPWDDCEPTPETLTRRLLRSISGGKSGQPKEAPSMVKIHHLPDDAGLLAQTYAKSLKAGAFLQKPLEQFLAEAATVPGVEGVGLVLRLRPNALPFLSICAFTDLSDLGKRNASSPRPRVARAFRAFEERLGDTLAAGFDVELAFVDARPNELQRIVRRFPHGQFDPFLGDPDEDTSVKLPRFGVSTEVGGHSREASRSL